VAQEIVKAACVAFAWIALEGGDKRIRQVERRPIDSGNDDLGDGEVICVSSV
jgi:hypothetical protein